MGTEMQLLSVVLLLLLLQLCLMNYKAFAQLPSEIYDNATVMTKPGCPFRCSGGSNITIPYPFGIGAECALDETFIITCNTSFHPPRPFIHSMGIEALSIRVNPSTVQVGKSRISKTYSSNDMDWTISGNCSLLDENQQIYTSNSCSLHSRCIPYWPDAFYCVCNRGYKGNPYLPNGCQDIDECKRPHIKEYCSKRCVNIPGSYICKRPNKKAVKIAIIGEEGNVEKCKLFTSKDLEKATDRYNKNRIIGKGGQGTVYKGMSTDGRIVAVKVSAKLDENNLEQFINEVVILSHINHRNVVKLHGCCLETEVPLLVYEFIPNGTLFQYIHEKNEEFPLSWDVRLRIATEVASALSYLHLAASLPIYHRDIKSTNILLDEKYRAKLADFGTSRTIAIDQTHLTTRVSGTFGYFDPEYFRSSQFTEKSDVYSFGVVLVELLTSQKPISSTRSEEMRGLTTYFMVALKEKRLFDILDAQVWNEGRKEEIRRVANLAKRCLNLSGRKRPTMREVLLELEGIRIPNAASTINELDEEGENDIIELNVP
ncbi:hypothetical protein LguiA_026321 [Lonicera macranthoides]